MEVHMAMALFFGCILVLLSLILFGLILYCISISCWLTRLKSNHKNEEPETISTYKFYSTHHTTTNQETRHPNLAGDSNQSFI